MQPVCFTYFFCFFDLYNSNDKLAPQTMLEVMTQRPKLARHLYNWLAVVCFVYGVADEVV